MDDADELVTAAEVAGVAAYGALEVDRDALSHAVREARAAGVEVDTLHAHAAELYLGTACGAGSRAALATLERLYIARVDDVVARRRVPRVDVAQRRRSGASRQCSRQQQESRSDCHGNASLTLTHCARPGWTRSPSHTAR